MILVDTSVWIEHLRNKNDRLKILLFEEQVVCHPFVIGELACGTLQKREQILSLLTALPEVELIEHEEVMSFIQGRRLYGRGIGWVDAHLLASALVGRTSLWTADPRLAAAATELGINYS